MAQQMTMTGKTCLVTGASGGIGKETALALAQMGATVLMVARDRARGDAAVADIRRQSPGAAIELFLADFSSQRQVRQLATDVSARHLRLDVLINNAAVVNAARHVTEDGLEATFAVNHMAPFLLTHMLRQSLNAAAPSRVVNVSSYLHNMAKTIPWDDLQSEREYRSHAVYNLTKLMNVLFTYQLARQGSGNGFTANCLHPGWPLKTDLDRQERGASGMFDRVTRLFASSARKGARTSVYLASSPVVAAVSGGYFTNCRVSSSSKLSNDRAAAERLWELSRELCGVAPRKVRPD